MDFPDLAKWIYGKYFVGHPIVGFAIIASILTLGLLVLLGLFWFRGVDKYNESRWIGTVHNIFSTPVQGEDTFIKIFNNSTVDVEVVVHVTANAGGTVKGISLGSIPAGRSRIFWAGSGVDSIAALAGLPVKSVFGAVFTLDAPKESVTAEAKQKRRGGMDVVLPVYTGTQGYKTE